MTPTIKTLISAALSIALTLPAYAQSVIFPQQQQPGAAHSRLDGSQYTLSNNLLSASFNTDNRSLKFNGCPEMGLTPGSELFEILLGDSTKLAASQMQMSNLRLVDLTGNPNAAKGSEKLDGKAIEATFSHGPLTVEWRAVLRNGSHYLRTELQLSTTDSLPMLAIYPMSYKLYAHEGVPAVVATLAVP